MGKEIWGERVTVQGRPNSTRGRVPTTWKDLDTKPGSAEVRKELVLISREK